MMITQNNNVFDQIADPPCSAVVMGRAEYQLQGNLITLTPMFNRYHHHIHHHQYHLHHHKRPPPLHHFSLFFTLCPKLKLC